MARRSVRVDGKTLERLRNERGFRRQVDLADAAHVDSTTVSRAETGSKETMLEATALKLAIALEVPIETLTHGGTMAAASASAHATAPAARITGDGAMAIQRPKLTAAGEITPLAVIASVRAYLDELEATLNAGGATDEQARDALDAAERRTDGDSS